MEKKRCYGCMKQKTASPICEHCGYDENTKNALHQLPAGTVLKEQYLIGRVLGQGGFGITYLGWDLYLDIPVAVKEYYPSGAVMRETSVTMDVVSCDGETGSRFRNNKERFMREAKMLARFSQVPEIVQVKNFFLANNTAYIVMEYVEGITLKQYVKEHGGKLSVEETLSILGPVMEALCKVHKAGLVHRDISPDNIMMLPQGGAKLLDFGAVRDVGAASVDKGLTKSTEAILKQGYAPIEQYQKRGSLGPWTDVYALCATMYYCMTGQVPPDAPERLLDYEELNLREKIPALSEVQLQALEHGMELRAEKRTNSMDMLHEELFREEPPVTYLVEPPLEYFVKSSSEQSAVTSTPKTTTQTGKTTHVTGTPPKKEKEKPRTGKGRMLLIGVLVAVAVLLLCLVPFFGGQDGGADPSPAKTESRAAEQTAKDGNTVSGTCGVGLTWTLDLNSGKLVVSGSGEMDDYRVDGINDNSALSYAPWSGYENQITSVTIENGLTVIGVCAFCQCTNLTAVQLPDTLVEIRRSAFDLCSLESLTLPESLKTIGQSVFSWSPLKTVTIPDSVEYVDTASFDCNGELESVTIGPNTRLNYDTWYPIFSGNGFTIYGYTNSMAEDYAQILGCNFVSTGVKEWDAEGQCGDDLYWHLDLGTGFLKIDGTGDMWDFNGTWMYGDNYEELWNNDWELPPWSKYRGKIYVVSIGDAVTSIGQNAFENCDNLVDVYFGASLERIGFQSFLSTAVDQIVLPNNVTRIDGFAFNWCEHLTELRLPENLERLEENAISECGNLGRLFVGQNTIIDESHGLPFTSDENGIFTTYPNLTIYGLQNSDAERFASEYGFPFEIGTRGWVAEAQGQCGDDVWWFLSGDTLVLYGTGETWRYRLSASDFEDWAKEAYEAGKAFATLPEFAKYYTSIRRVVILPGVEQLMNGLFVSLSHLEEIDFGTVSECYAHFEGCNRLTEIVLPETIRHVGSWMFFGCTNLEKLTILGGQDGIEDELVYHCTKLREVWFGGQERIDKGLNILDSSSTTVASNVTFYVKPGSDAERYAKEYDISYEYYD